MKIRKSFFFCKISTTLFYKIPIRRRSTRKEFNVKILAWIHIFAYKIPFRWFKTFRNNQPGNFSSKEKLPSRHPREIFHLLIPNSESRFPNVSNSTILRPIHPIIVRCLNTRSLATKNNIHLCTQRSTKKQLIFFVVSL